MSAVYMTPGDNFATSYHHTTTITEPPPSYADSVRRAKRARHRASISSSGTFPDPENDEDNLVSERSPLLQNVAGVHGSRQQQHQARVQSAPSRRLRKYFRPLRRKAYWLPVLHLILLNFLFALVAWLYLFLGVLIGTTLLLTLPLGTLIWWLTLIGSRFFADAEIRMQSYFHGIQPPPQRRAVFHQPPVEIDPESGIPIQRTFLQNSYDMFLDWEGSYIPIFHFLVVKAPITLVLTIFALVVIPPAVILIIPAPYVLRLFRRIGKWQALIAVEGLSQWP
ncbi:uncharacterized protein EI90DRAFT_3129023 [Cantharellus anzutake]|uniref:uncharacterized protein n=1 Tax=Cantharellus anzutake TaxID=1750568 RepID=UPI0019080DB5|nr:uncharacterized protein EI90DRAFT_3129023 [Cantharellus anzutake]KAF8325182.1 hypothetical protein EI90DRAFT_3129023 [Cantharellus anzutake]